MQNRVCRCLSRVFIAFACFTAGCFETETALGPVEHASVDARLVGDFKTGENGSEDIIVRNFNGREYYIEQRTSGRETACYAGFVVAVKEALRARAPAGGRRHAGQEARDPARRPGGRREGAPPPAQRPFFADQPHETRAKLRATVEANLENAAMYDG